MQINVFCSFVRMVTSINGFIFMSRSRVNMCFMNYTKDYFHNRVWKFLVVGTIFWRNAGALFKCVCVCGGGGGTRLHLGLHRPCTWQNFIIWSGQGIDLVKTKCFNLLHQGSLVGIVAALRLGVQRLEASRDKIIVFLQKVYIRSWAHLAAY
jgi:hypothetical protein